jgi:hypothetical protein
MITGRESRVQVTGYAGLASIVSIMIVTNGAYMDIELTGTASHFWKVNGIPQGIEREGYRGEMAWISGWKHVGMNSN